MLSVTREDKLIPPLGGRGLCPLAAPQEERMELLRLANSLPSVDISTRAFGDLVMLGIGGFTPLDGFMNRADWHSVCENMTLADGTFWPMPVVLDVSDSEADAAGDRTMLTHKGEVVGVLDVTEKWRMSDADLWFECERIFRGSGVDSQDFSRTAPERHPGVKHVLGRKNAYLGGRLTVLTERPYSSLSDEFMLSPSELRILAEARGWREIVCLQLRNPPHRSHEYLARIGLEVHDALVIHTPMGALKPGDLPVDVRLRCIRALIDNYLPSERAIVAGYPLDMRYAGPREALLHAAFRQNYGIGAQIVGRDHAGVADFYAPFEAQEIFNRLPRHTNSGKNLLTRPIRIKWPFYCRKCDSMASLNTCPHSMSDRVLHSGSVLRKCFSEKIDPPEGFIRQEVFDILREHYEHAPITDQIAIYGAADGSSMRR